MVRVGVPVSQSAVTEEVTALRMGQVTGVMYFEPHAYVI
jgi:hypothetical protein